MVAPYRVIHLSVDTRPRVEEVMGSKEKFWLVNQRTGERVLWKKARDGTGEDWSEKVAYQIARELAIPCPRVELATLGGDRGILCWDFLQRWQGPPPFRRSSLVHGNELLVARDPGYPRDQQYNVKQHSIEAVRAALLPRRPPYAVHRRRSHVRQDTAFQSFVGYLMLDALIGNTDRHHENWGIELPPRSEPLEQQTLPSPESAQGLSRDAGYLAPSYDHASSLGREMSDRKRKGRLDTSGRGTVADYASKARSALFANLGDRPMSPHEAMMVAGTYEVETLHAFRDHLEGIDFSRFQRCIDRVPDHLLSPLGKEFTTALLAHNRQRVLELEE